MSKTPEICAEFFLIKKDSDDFDRDEVSRRLKITPSMSLPPRFSKGKTYSAEDFDTFDGMSVLLDGEAPYHILLHAVWGLKTNCVPCRSVNEVLNVLEEFFCDKIDALKSICRDMDLLTQITIVIRADSNDLPEMVIERESIVFWGDIGAEIGFDLYLDSSDGH